MRKPTDDELRAAFQWPTEALPKTTRRRGRWYVPRVVGNIGLQHEIMFLSDPEETTPGYATFEEAVIVLRYRLCKQFAEKLIRCGRLAPPATS